MPNLIELGKTYIPLLDEVYKLGALSSVLDANENLVKIAQNGKDLLVAKMALQGLADTSRGGDYVDGDVTFEWETKTPSWDRNRMFKVDAVDDIETAGLSFGMLSSEFIRTKVVPELDAVRFATYAGTAGILGTAGALADTTAFLDALLVAINAQDEAEVPTEGRILFATPTLINGLLRLDTTKSKEVLSRFSQVVKVPQTRFYSAITLKDGKSLGDEDGGYIKDAVAGKDINFLIVHKSAIIQTLKHVAPKIIPAEINQTGDNHKFGYRAYGIAETFDNKLSGIYCHTKA